MKKEILSYKNLTYVISYPDGFDASRKYPVILHLHGAGGRGRDIGIINDHPIYRHTENYALEALIVSPQCFADTWFEIFEQLQDFAKYIVAQPYTDASRVYLTGSSMGGYTSWQLAMTMPEYFAALVPVCGGGMYWNAGRLKDVPVWAFHGIEDGTVLPEESVKMVNAVNKKGGSAKLTLINGAAHNAWDTAFGSRETFDWMLSHKKTVGE